MIARCFAFLVVCDSGRRDSIADGGMGLRMTTSILSSYFDQSALT